MSVDLLLSASHWEISLQLIYKVYCVLLFPKVYVCIFSEEKEKGGIRSTGEKKFKWRRRKITDLSVSFLMTKIKDLTDFLSLFSELSWTTNEVIKACNCFSFWHDAVDVLTKNKLRVATGILIDLLTKKRGAEVF